MAGYVNPVIGSVSPNLYAAAKTANLTTNEATQVEQMAYTIKQHRKLAGMDVEQARKQYDALDPNIQGQLKFMYKDAEYLKPPVDAMDKVKGIFTGALKVAASPLIGLFKVAGAYSRVINEPYLVARQVAQGKDLFAAKTWTDAWDGRNLYDNDALQKNVDYYGRYDVEVAKGLLQGKTPGEIVEAFGKPDAQLLESIKKAYNEPDKFQQVLDDVKFAQMSPGRDLARALDNHHIGPGASKSAQKMSGITDFIYQIAIDPLTWLSGGLSKGATQGERIAQGILDKTNRGISSERAVAEAFEDPKLFDYWEKGLGPVLKRYRDAETPAARADAVREIKNNFPGYDNQDVVKALTTGDEHIPGGVVDAASAQKYFEQARNLHLLMAGRVDGLTYMRNGVAVARTNRNLFDGLGRYLDREFNLVRGNKELNEGVEEFHKVLSNPTDALNRFANGEMKVVQDSVKEIKSWRNRVSLMASRSPAGLEVLMGKNAIKTASNFTARARQIMPKDMAEAYTQRFLESSLDEQFVIIKNLDIATMYSMGLGGTHKGEEYIARTIEEKYGGIKGMGTRVDVAINPNHVDELPEGIVHMKGDGHFASKEGAMQPFQATYAVGPLPYQEIGEQIWNIRSKKNAINAIGGMTMGHHANKMVNAWSILTLFPRLGIRSAIDEAFMYIISAPTRDVLKLVTRQGNKMGNVAKTFTGSQEATGPIKRGIQKVFGKGANIDLVNMIGKKIHINPEEAISITEREDIIAAKARELKVHPAQLSSLAKREAVAEHVGQMYAPYLKNEKDLAYLLQAFAHSPDALGAMAQSLVAHSALSGKYGDKVAKAVITPSNFDKALAEMGLKSRRKMYKIQSSSLTEREVTLGHFENFVKRFVGNKATISVNGKEKVYLNPGKIFMKHAALRTGKDMRAALDEGMVSVGFRKVEETGMWEVANEKLVDEFLSLSSHTQSGKVRLLDEAGIAREQLGRMFIDMYETFHGSATNFNQKLYDAMSTSLDEMLAFNPKASWNEAAAKMSLDDFDEATQGFRLEGEFSTSIDFKNLDKENALTAYGNKAMEMMDQQVTGIFRQPAVMIAYTKLRNDYAGLEEQMAKQLYNSRLGFWEAEGVKYGNKKVMAECEAIAEKHFTELSLRNAADGILKYADNPTIRSNFAYSARTLGRYYRATEDFYRRIYRLKDVSPRVLTRMRLMHVGLDASGIFHEDAQGNAYVVMPMDNVVFKATDTTLRALTGNLGYSQPNFNQFTMKLNMMNPSFSQDAGLPTLSGPVAGLSVIGIKNFLGTVPGKLPFIGQYLQAPSQQLGESIDTFALGNIGDNIDITRAIVPAGLQKIYAMLDPSEKSRQEVTAAQQAIAYNAAHGRYLDANATDAQKNNYLKQIRISAHNIIFLRNLLGLIAPVSPGMMESKGLPDYIKDVGVTGLRAEFFDILNGISKTNNGDVVDPYEQALATFIGKNPGKLIYTVSREDKQTKVLVKNTDGLKNWAIQNKRLVDTYGEAAYIFAPQAGDFNAGTFNWIQAAGLMENKTLENYYQDLLVAEDKQRYYDIAREEKKQLEELSDPEIRAYVINAATDARNALKASNPLLTPELIGQGNNIGGEEVMLLKVKQIIADPNASIEPATRKRMALAIQMMQDFIAFSNNPDYANMTNFADIKAQRKDQVEADLKELMLGDLYVTEANRAIFKSILNFYSRDSYYAFKAGR
jgi:hypothetical protein